MAKRIVAAAAAAMVLASGPSFSQSAGPASPGAPDQQTTTSRAAGLPALRPSTFMRASKLDDVEVIGLDYNRIGEIDDVLIGTDGKVTIVVEVGGFLGIGEKKVALPIELFMWNTGDISPTTPPFSSTTPATRPGAEAARSAGPETMPGSQISREVLESTSTARPPEVTGATGPVAPADPRAAPATLPVVEEGGVPKRAVLRLTRRDLEDAPAFRYER